MRMLEWVDDASELVWFGVLAAVCTGSGYLLWQVVKVLTLLVLGPVI